MARCGWRTTRWPAVPGLTWGNGPRPTGNKPGFTPRRSATRWVPVPPGSKSSFSVWGRRCRSFGKEGSWRLRRTGQVDAAGRLREAAFRFEAHREFLDAAHDGNVAHQQAALVPAIDGEHAGADRFVGDHPELVGLAGWERREIVGVEEPAPRLRFHKHQGIRVLGLVGPVQIRHLGGGGGQDAQEILPSGQQTRGALAAAPRFELRLERYDLFLVPGKLLARGPQSFDGAFQLIRRFGERGFLISQLAFEIGGLLLRFGRLCSVPGCRRSFRFNRVVLGNGVSCHAYSHGSKLGGEGRRLYLQLLPPFVKLMAAG